MPTRVQSFQDGQRVTVNTLIKNPTVIPRRIISMLEQAFLVDSILRKADSVPSGVVTYEESTPLFADTDVEIVEEYGEIPAAMGSDGIPRTARTVKRALALKISEEMRRRNKMDRVNTQMVQIKNTMVRAWEDAFLAIVLNHPSVQTVAATTAWDSSSSKIRFDLGEAAKLIVKSSSDTQANNRFGFNPDTLVIPEDTKWDFLASDEVNKVFEQNPLAAQAPRYTGELPGRFYGFRVVSSWRLPATKAILLQSGIVGGVADERSLEATDLYEDKPRETWRADVVRQSAVFLDQPKAAAIITGI